MKRNISEHKQLHAKLQGKVPSHLLKYLPHRLWKLGDITIIPIPEELKEYKVEIGQQLLKIEKKQTRTILGKIGPTTGVMRKPQFEVIAGERNTVTTFKELGCWFKIDAAKLTFSPGNHAERKRLIELARKNEVIIDLFACIGNLSLPIAVHNQPKKVFATEINPIAYHYLKESIALNKIEDRIEAFLGDNRQLFGQQIKLADRVISGYLKSDWQQIVLAVQLCKKGGVVHYHEATPTNKSVTNRPVERLKKAGLELKREVTILEKRTIKPYAPGIDHVVVDAEIH
ncbi:MAG: class I SAM-dependent methyltransferase family protein [Asgard group archaeon]|nr:class I SAM-dependent methyltransferase family protein [Asgard group archaeon]